MSQERREWMELVAELRGKLAAAEQAARWCWSGFVDGCDGGESLTRWPWLAEVRK